MNIEHLEAALLAVKIRLSSALEDYSDADVKMKPRAGMIADLKKDLDAIQALITSRQLGLDK